MCDYDGGPLGAEVHHFEGGTFCSPKCALKMRPTPQFCLQHFGGDVSLEAYRGDTVSRVLRRLRPWEAHRPSPACMTTRRSLREGGVEPPRDGHVSSYGGPLKCWVCFREGVSAESPYGVPVARGAYLARGERWTLEGLFCGWDCARAYALAERPRRMTDFYTYYRSYTGQTWNGERMKPHTVEIIRDTLYRTPRLEEKNVSFHEPPEVPIPI